VRIGTRAVALVHALSDSILVNQFLATYALQRIECGTSLDDGPYLRANVAPYKPWNILQIEVIAEFKAAEYDWIFCEQDQPIYVEAFGKPVLRKVVQNRASNVAVTGEQEFRTECVWTSESYRGASSQKWGEA
jgi:hypothetical protein